MQLVQGRRAVRVIPRALHLDSGPAPCDRGARAEVGDRTCPGSAASSGSDFHESSAAAELEGEARRRRANVGARITAERASVPPDEERPGLDVASASSEAPRPWTRCGGNPPPTISVMLADQARPLPADRRDAGVDDLLERQTLAGATGGHRRERLVVVLRAADAVRLADAAADDPPPVPETAASRWCSPAAACRCRAPRCRARP